MWLSGGAVMGLRGWALEGAFALGDESRDFEESGVCLSGPAGVGEHLKGEG